MYKSRRGKSGSSKPYVTEAPEWSNTNSNEVTNLVVELGKAGHSTAAIGTIMRDQHAVPDVRLVTGKRIGVILAENDIGGTYPEDMMNLMRQAARIIEHLGSGNHKDLHNKRSLEITESKIRKLASYYISEGKLPSEWRYKRDELRLMVE
tara:strand:- start:5199 stop:5648 length:450 start_codon:yes stop_codon:yes gene_type:complete